VLTHYWYLCSGSHAIECKDWRATRVPREVHRSSRCVRVRRSHGASCTRQDDHTPQTSLYPKRGYEELVAHLAQVRRRIAVVGLTANKTTPFILLSFLFILPALFQRYMDREGAPSATAAYAVRYEVGEGRLHRWCTVLELGLGHRYPEAPRCLSSLLLTPRRCGLLLQGERCGSLIAHGI